MRFGFGGSLDGWHVRTRNPTLNLCCKVNRQKTSAPLEDRAGGANLPPVFSLSPQTTSPSFASPGSYPIQHEDYHRISKHSTRTRIISHRLPYAHLAASRVRLQSFTQPPLARV